MGITIYALWRGINFFGLEPLLTSTPPNWIKFNLPDGIWLYSLLSSLFLIWKDMLSKHLIAGILIVLFLSFISEVFQYLDVIPGTFDVYDLVSYLIAAMIFVIQFLKNIKPSLLTLKFKL